MSALSQFGEPADTVILFCFVICLFISIFDELPIQWMVLHRRKKAGGGSSRQSYRCRRQIRYGCWLTPYLAGIRSQQTNPSKALLSNKSSPTQVPLVDEDFKIPTAPQKVSATFITNVTTSEVQSLQRCSPSHSIVEHLTKPLQVGIIKTVEVSHPDL